MSKNTELYESLKSRAKEAGLSLRKLAELAGVTSKTIENWRTKVPQSISTWQKMDDILTSHKTVNNT